MIDPKSVDVLGNAIRTCVEADRQLLDRLRTEVRTLRPKTVRIKPRSTTAISLVGTDGGNNQIRFDPLMIQLVRVVDSAQNEYCLEVITPNTRLEMLNRQHLDEARKGQTPLGRMMELFRLSGLEQLSSVFNPNPEKRSSSWVMVYREMMEWAVLLSLVREKAFGTDTIIIRDGFLRSKVFAHGLFGKYADALDDAIEQQHVKNRRRLYVVGIAKHSKVLQTYRLAMALEGVMRNAYPCYVEIPEALQKQVYRWPEYADSGSENERFVAGRLFFAKFGSGVNDPIWAVDILASQVNEASTIFGYLLADAIDGFPVPFYPQCLQRAHEHAALVDFDFDILQDQVSAALRDSLGDRKGILDELELQEADPSDRRY